MEREATLSEVAAVGRIDVLRDARFNDLALLGHAAGRSLVYATEERFLRSVATPGVAAVITTTELASLVPGSLGVALARSPETAFYRVHEHLARDRFYWSDFQTVIAKSASVHERAWIAPKNVRIGRDVEIGPLVAIHERVTIGAGTIVRSGTVIGSEGYEFKGRAMRQGRPSRRASDYGDGVRRVVHGGSVTIGDRVEIHSNTVIDRSLFRAPTTIGNDTKIDNLVYVAHSVRIGERCLIVGGAIIAGSVTIGNDVWIGPRSVILPGLSIGDEAAIVIGSVVTRSLAAGERVVSGDLKLHRV